MKPKQEQFTKKSLKAAIVALQSVDVLLNGVFARDTESAESDGFPASSTGGGSGKGSHSDRTMEHATREAPHDLVHNDVAQIVDAVNEIRAKAQRIERIARKLTAHERSVIV